ncbi:L-aminoadipate-semialdehyde dehydrogenase-phosphopantetheinyl transferase [Elysia marginata]|uniref:L-aminoadipate-semialdehyde dehydrogenase-phosphopantetheinyl transferase n=1 Tax=Elysia marginata TaxID=1093978 RepID=A0AAV4IZ63_9GAST|nr:L-aminoadipate-semialdehyde dehydrogenase-phosphopantetheinyl transferase [Elysia marginata]
MSEQVRPEDPAMFTGRSVRLAIKVKNWLPNQAEWTHAAQCVQVEEKERIGKFMFRRDAKAAMVGRLLMRFSLSKILGIPSRTLLFKRTEKGKPYLVSPIDRCNPRCDVSFNVSHQGDYVVFAAERGSPLGVDIMKVEWPRNTPVSAFFKTMHRQYTDQEWSEVKRYRDEMDQLKVFYRLWCLKESIVKAYGTGIGFEVSRLNFSFGCQNVLEDEVIADTKVEIDGDPAPEWTFEESFLDGHCVAVAVKYSLPNDQRPSSNAINRSSPRFQVVDMAEVLAGCEPLTGSVPDHQYWELFDAKEEQPGLS